MNAQVNRKIPFLNNPFFVMFLLMPFFKPASLQFIAPQLESVFDIWKIISLAAAIGMYIYNRKISKIILAIVVYEAVLFFSTFANKGDYWKILVICGTIVGFSMLLELCIKNNCRVFLKSIFCIYFILILANLVLIFAYPDGLGRDNYYYNKYNFLAIDNGLSQIFIPVMALTCVYTSFNKGRRLLSLVLMTMISVTVVVTWSATGVVMWFAMMLYILFIYKKKLTPFFNSRLLFAVFIILQVLIVFLRVQEIFAYIIEDILGKSITFTGRTVIWDSAMELIRYSPWLGYGVYEGHGLILYYGKFMYAHNGILEVLLQGGVVALVVFGALFVIAGNSLYRYRNNHISGIISAAVFSMLLGMLMESFANSIWLYGLLIISFAVPDIISQYEDTVVAAASENKENRYSR